MDVLDEKGRLFGRVNVVDAFVVLFALTIVIAGAALVYGDGLGDEPTETMHVTLVSETPSATTLEIGEIDLESGTFVSPRRGTTANITDVHRTAGPRV